MKIFFIRHGETTGDIENRYGGDYDDHLSDKGKEQSETLAEILKDKGIEIIYSSSLIRAQETAQAIAEKTGCEVKVESEIRERNQYGILTGMTKEEAKKKYQKQVELLKDRLNTIDGAESYEDFNKRVSDTFEKLTSNSKYNTIAIVSHGGPFRVLFRDILKWGELEEIGDCAFVELNKKDQTFSWVHSGGFTPSFQVDPKDYKEYINWGPIGDRIMERAIKISEIIGSFQVHLKNLKELDLPASDFVVISSGALAVRGIREAKDLDVIVKGPLWNELKKKYNVVKENGVDRINCGNNIEILGANSVFTDSTVVPINEIFEKADVFDDTNYISLEHLKKIKLKLGREKDLQDIKLIDEYIKR